ncbi:hypothetical protein VF21_03939 [Pseudogymnoascus sp. 05NY08]|nr:hypothetical protein VF21_03939 [Pseudogymnoascus sp. 05NY08]
MEPNINPSPKLNLKPLVTATLQQARRLSRPSKPPTTSPAPVVDPRYNPSPCILTTSLFLTLLPLEIRARIYQFVFAGRELHLIVPWFSKDKPLMAKLRHKEFLYALTGFTVLHPPALTMFVDADIKGADFMRWVRVLRLEYEFAVPVKVGNFDVSSELDQGVDWNETCRCLVLLTRLKVLHVTIYPVDVVAKRPWAGWMVWEMLGGLGRARAEEFRVSVRKPFMKFREVLGEAPFELCEVYEDY